jgi:hypothetical protein
MTIHPCKFIPIVMLVLGCHAPSAMAQAGVSTGEQLHAQAVASFREARFSEAYGRFSALADAGHAPAAATALWMFLNGPTVFGKDWDSNQEQLTAWAQLARQPVPVMVGRVYAQPVRATTATASVASTRTLR